MQLFIVATPIGNLSDLTYRAKQVLSEVDVIVCEDTRQTKKLLEKYGIKNNLLSYYQHSGEKIIDKIIQLLASGKSVSYVTDAGTPGISDPGGKLVEALTAQLGSKLKVIPIPGPSAVTAALSISGFPSDKYQFLGFIPHKKGRQKFIDNLKTVSLTTVFYESVYRIEKLLDQLIQVIPDRQIVLARELTKRFESVYRGTPSEVKKQLSEDKVKGEFVVVVRGS